MVEIVDFRSPVGAAKQQQYAVALCRVSTEDQYQRGLSIPEQRSRIEKWAESHGVEVLRWEEIHHSAFRGLDEDTRVTDLLKYAAEDPRITLFLVDEKSRFARRKFLRVTWQEELRRAGVKVVGVSEPDYDRNSIHGIWLEGISETKDEARSIETAYHTTKGMARNAATRDPETGFCYKNGGIAPLGYDNQRVVMGRDPRGKDIVKLLWAVNEKEAALVRYIVLTLWTDTRMSYAGIRDHLNSAEPKYDGITEPIRSTKGVPWSVTSIREICMRGLEGAYTGYYYWNRTGRNLRGTGAKWKSQDDWVVIENAHPAIIDRKEWLHVKKIMTPIVAKNKATKRKSTKLENSPYLFSGNNAVGETMFVCTSCGSSINSNQVAKVSYYLCSSYTNKGLAGCKHGIYIRKDDIEPKVIAAIGAHFTRSKIKRLAADFNVALDRLNADQSLEVSRIQRSIDTTETSIANILQAIEVGSSSVPTLVKRLETLQKELKALNKAKESAKKDRPLIPRMDGGAIIEQVRLLKKCMNDPTVSNRDRRLLVRYFIRQLRFYPETFNVEILFWANPEDKERLRLVAHGKKEKDGDPSIMFPGGAGDRALPYTIHLSCAPRKRRRVTNREA